MVCGIATKITNYTAVQRPCFTVFYWERWSYTIRTVKCFLSFFLLFESFSSFLMLFDFRDCSFTYVQMEMMAWRVQLRKQFWCLDWETSTSQLIHELTVLAVLQLQIRLKTFDRGIWCKFWWISTWRYSFQLKVVQFMGISSVIHMKEIVIQTCACLAVSSSGINAVNW